MVRNRRRTTVLPVLLATALGMSSPARAQVRAPVRVLDEGTFSLFVGGTRVGREDFSIRAAAGAADGAYVAQGNVLRGESRLAVRLNTDSLGFPLRFTLEASEEGHPLETISGEARGDLWSGRAIRPSGERAREFRLPRGSLAAEVLVIHHLWFLLRFAGGRSAPVLRPRSLTLDSVTVEDAGPDRVSLGLREFVSRKWLVRVAGQEVPREAWTDLGGRLLRVRIPGADLEAVRDEPPAETPASPGA